MEALAIFVLLIVLVVVLVRGSGRDERIARLEGELERHREGIDVAYRRIGHLEQGMTEAWQWLHGLRRENEALKARLAEARVEVREERAPAAAEPPKEEPTAAEATAEPAPAPEREGEAAKPIEAPAPQPVIPAWPSPSPAPSPSPSPSPAPSPAPAPVPQAAPEPEPVPEAAREPLPEPPPPSSAEPPPRFEWERWIGVRGAAALGACVLVIAALYFFKYSIEAGLISPTTRVVLGTLVGTGGLVASELMLRRRYAVLANWLAGAGVAILYTAFWAASSHYKLIGVGPAFALMTLVTLTCGLLARRHDSMVIALLGLLGGFATPVAVSSGADHPIGLFGYLLLLDVALLYLARTRRWPLLGALSLVGTGLYQVGWIGGRMGPERVGMGMGIVVVFGALYGATLPEPEEEEGELWKLTRAAAVLLPFTFGLYFGVRADLGEHLYPLGLMLATLSAGAAWMSRARRSGWIAATAAVAGMTVMGTWILRHEHASVAVEAAGFVGVIALVFHAFRELEGRRPSNAGPASAARAAAIASTMGLAVLVATAALPSSHEPWPWLAGWLALGAMAVRASILNEATGASPGAGLRVVVALFIALGVPLVHLVHASDFLFPAEPVFLSGAAVVTAIAVLGAVLLRRAAAADDDVVPSGVPRSGGALDAGLLIAPFVYALYFAGRPELPHTLVPIAALLLAAAGAAVWASRGAQRASAVSIVAAAAGLTVLALWVVTNDAAAAAIPLVGAAVLFAAVFHVGAEVGEIDARAEARIAGASVIAGLGGMVLLLAAASGTSAHVPWAFVAGSLALGGSVLRHARIDRWGPLHLPVGLVLGLGLPGVAAAHASDPAFVQPALWMAMSVVVAMAFSALSLAKRDPEGVRWSSHAAALLALLLSIEAFESKAPPAVVMAATIALIALALVSAARLGHGGWAFVAALAGAFVHAAYALAVLPGRAAPIVLAGQFLAFVLVATWPVITARRFREDRWAFRAAALAGPFWFGGLYLAWIESFGRGATGLLPIAMGLVITAVAARARAVLPEDGPATRSALVWLFGASLCAVSVAIPLQLENEWITIGWAIEGATLLVLWRRVDHAGLKYTALAHLAVVTARLVVNPWLLDYHARGALPVVNWLLYTYWIPTACLVAAWYLLRDLEADRARPAEQGLYFGDRPIFSVASAASAIVVFFVWENLTIFDAFGQGTELHVAFDRMPARDLTLSIAWAVYALFLLGVGVARRSAALRWTSLALLIVTIGKVFLYDLSHLHDLYRVMSLVGLALSLILVSLLYQRFVFGRRDEAESATAPKK